MLTSTRQLNAVDGQRQESDRIEVLHWDGRLDNRDDLVLRLRDSLAGDNSNAAIARATYECWGVDGLVHLIGDWSLVIRDHVKRTTVLASDFAGVRPLYYHVDAGHVLWSSRLETLVAVTEISELDEQYIAGFLMFGGYPNRTPYQGIYSVPPGHAVCVSAEGATSIHRFWSMPIGDVIQYRNERRYEEELRSLFREAVAVRLQTEAPVVAELSGGLDSSSVVCMANHLTRSGAVSATRLNSLSFTWRNSLDEPFIREVESHCGIEGVHISTHDVRLMNETEVGRALPEPFRPLHLSVAAAARRLGASTILTGQLGDLMMGNFFDDSLQVASSLRRFQIRRAFEETLLWSKIIRLPFYRVLWRAAQAALPPSLTPAAIYSASDGSYTPKSSETSLASVSDRTGLSDPESLFSKTWMQAPPERRKYFRALTTIFELRQLQPAEPLQHLDYTHPFAHRPLVEFLLTVPANILCGPGEPRRLMRSALSDLWPRRVRERRSKALFNSPWQEALRPLARALLKERQLEVVERGFVDRAGFRSRLERLSVELDCNSAQLRQIILLELWLRKRADGRYKQALRAA
jgi:asparagine synthase (glutamine-hydrolysing)